MFVQSGSFGEPFGGPGAIFGGSLGFLGAPGWPETGPKRARDAPRPPQDALVRPVWGAPAFSKN